jgi:hypothetical protein
MKNGPWPAPSVLVTTLHSAAWAWQSTNPERDVLPRRGSEHTARARHAARAGTTGTAAGGSAAACACCAWRAACRCAARARCAACCCACSAGLPSHAQLAADAGCPPTPGAPEPPLAVPAAPGCPQCRRPDWARVRAAGSDGRERAQPSSICRRLTPFAVVSTFDSRFVAIHFSPSNARSLRLGKLILVRARVLRTYAPLWLPFEECTRQHFESGASRCDSHETGNFALS